ncbi:MAG: hypothetical protein Q4E12_00910 [Coriobacteriia bacterium]|nr:hypothetical protein [Coriobacteriia bacterium]
MTDRRKTYHLVEGIVFGITLLAIVVFIACAAGSTQTNSKAYSPEQFDFDTHWTYAESGSSFTAPLREGLAGQTLVLQNTLPQLDESQVLFFDCGYASVSITIDGTRIYGTKLPVVAGHTTFLGTRFVSVLLDISYSGKPIEVSFTPAYAGETFDLRQIGLTTTDKLRSDIVYKYSARGLMALTC